MMVKPIDIQMKVEGLMAAEPQSPISGLTLGEIYEREVERERRKTRRTDCEIPRSRARHVSQPVAVQPGQELRVAVTEHDNPPPPAPKRPAWMSAEAWRVHLAANGYPVVKPFPKRLRWPV
jgi:hypothetical protein